MAAPGFFSDEVSATGRAVRERAKGHDQPLLPYLAAAHARWLTTQPQVGWSQAEATLLFADISGFTPLTERLARRGKVGAEELTDLLNSVFTELLTVAGTHGGD